MRFKNILCPIDFSEDSRGALELAVEMANASEGSLTLLHVNHLPGWAMSEGDVAWNDFLRKQHGESEQSLVEHAERARGLGAKRVKTTQASGTPWDAIVGIAKEGSFDLIVMGTHGRTGIRHALMGSVAERVVRHAPCPVLLQRLGG